jgi:hypothetical protein
VTKKREMFLLIVFTAGFSFCCYEFYQMYNDRPSLVEKIVCYLIDDEFPMQKTSTPYAKLDMSESTAIISDQLTKRVMSPAEEKMFQLV